MTRAATWCAWRTRRPWRAPARSLPARPEQANDWVRQQRAVERVREYAELNGFDPDEAGNTLDVAVTFVGGKTRDGERHAYGAYGIHATGGHQHRAGQRQRRRPAGGGRARGYRPGAGRIGLAVFRHLCAQALGRGLRVHLSARLYQIPTMPSWVPYDATSPPI